MKTIKLSKSNADCRIMTPVNGVYSVCMVNAHGSYGYRWYPALDAQFKDLRKAKRYARLVLKDQSSWIV